MTELRYALVFGISAGILLLASLATPLISIEHSFPGYNQADTKLEISCGLFQSDSNIDLSEMGVASCAALIKKINADNNAIFFVMPSGVTPQLEVIDYVGIVILVLCTAALIIRSLFQTLFTLILARYCFLASACLGIVLVNATLGAVQSLHAAPDPGAQTSCQIGTAFLMLAGTPLVALTTGIRKRS
tara:strand:+ start:2092 stop:2655 length:564 start_codon:yes stop_codon:yes gene_type:complete